MKNRRTAAGTELTPEYLEELAAEAEAGYEYVDGKIVYLGRPALSREGPSIRLQVRVEPELNKALTSIADSEERTISEVARDALREYVGRRRP